jgi:hypothetical protein
MDNAGFSLSCTVLPIQEYLQIYNTYFSFIRCGIYNIQNIPVFWQNLYVNMQDGKFESF